MSAADAAACAAALDEDEADEAGPGPSTTGAGLSGSGAAGPSSLPRSGGRGVDSGDPEDDKGKGPMQRRREQAVAEAARPPPRSAAQSAASEALARKLHQQELLQLHATVQGQREQLEQLLQPYRTAGTAAVAGALYNGGAYGYAEGVEEEGGGGGGGRRRGRRRGQRSGSEEDAQQGSEEEAGSEEEVVDTPKLWGYIQLVHESEALKGASPPQSLQRVPGSYISGADLVIQALTQQQQQQKKRKAQWCITMGERLKEVGAAGLGPETLTLPELAEELEMDPYPGDVERLVLVSGSIVPVNRQWPLTPEVATAINEAVASQPGVLCGVIASELGAAHTVCVHGQLTYFFELPEEEVATVGLAQARTLLQRDMATVLERAWSSSGGRGGGLVHLGLVSVCGSDKALKIVELMWVYPWKVLVHLHPSEAGLGLGVCTLNWPPEANEDALCFARSPVLEEGCLQGSGCAGHDRCRPGSYKGVTGSFTDCMAVGYGLRGCNGLSLFTVGRGGLQFTPDEKTQAEAPCTELGLAVGYGGLRRVAGCGLRPDRCTIGRHIAGRGTLGVFGRSRMRASCPHARARLPQGATGVGLTLAESMLAHAKASARLRGKKGGQAAFEQKLGFHDPVNAPAVEEGRKKGGVKAAAGRRKCDHEPPQPNGCKYCYFRVSMQKSRAKKKAEEQAEGKGKGAKVKVKGKGAKVKVKGKGAKGKGKAKAWEEEESWEESGEESV